MSTQPYGVRFVAEAEVTKAEQVQEPESCETQEDQ